jgi:hypothetical protein
MKEDRWDKDRHDTRSKGSRDSGALGGEKEMGWMDGGEVEAMIYIARERLLCCKSSTASGHILPSAVSLHNTPQLRHDRQCRYRSPVQWGVLSR